MRLSSRLLILVPLLAPALANAAPVWSTCQTIASVTTEPNLSSLLITLQPGISGCSAQGVTGATNFTAGQEGLVSTDLNGVLATSLTAYTLGKQVLIAYDNASTSCYSTAVSIGGYNFQRP